MVTLKRGMQGKWTQDVVTSRLRPILKAELILSLTEAGFNSMMVFGSMTGAPFDPETSPNLVRPRQEACVNLPIGGTGDETQKWHNQIPHLCPYYSYISKLEHLI